ncbi:hypothetical protein chiPu_0022211, partial [Chiloscyllium punctatum]|nr:hypothetical protein [Chiloscyllium punctatum]
MLASPPGCKDSGDNGKAGLTSGSEGSTSHVMVHVGSNNVRKQKLRAG